MTKNPGRGTGYTATWGAFPRTIEGQGATPAEARSALADAIAVALTAITEHQPRFARNEQTGALYVAVPARDGGSTWWRVTGDQARISSYASTPAGSAFDNVTGFRVIPAQ